MENGLKIVRRRNMLVMTGDISPDKDWKQTSLLIEQDGSSESVVTVKFKVPAKKLLDIDVMED